MNREREVPDVAHTSLTPRGAGGAGRDLVRASPNEAFADLGSGKHPPPFCLRAFTHAHGQLAATFRTAFGRQPLSHRSADFLRAQFSRSVSSRCCLANTPNGPIMTGRTGQRQMCVALRARLSATLLMALSVSLV
jgi:hypothetical protein